MKYTRLASALLTLLTPTVYADLSAPAMTAPSSKTMAAPQAPVMEPGPVVPPAADTSKIPAPAASIDAKSPANNCQYHIPANTTAIESSTILTWAEHATVQAFEFNPATIDAQLSQLKACFTDQGYQGFNDALQKSGNINAIKSQLLNVSSQMDGEPNITSSKDNQWRVTVPLQVVYQNNKQKFTQLLSIDLLIGRKITGDLGIMQMIATPRPEAGGKAPLPNAAAAKTPPMTAQEPTTAGAKSPTESMGAAEATTPGKPNPVASKPSESKPSAP